MCRGSGAAGVSTGARRASRAKVARRALLHVAPVSQYALTTGSEHHAGFHLLLVLRPAPPPAARAPPTGFAGPSRRAAASFGARSATRRRATPMKRSRIRRRRRASLTRTRKSRTPPSAPDGVVVARAYAWKEKSIRTRGRPARRPWPPSSAGGSPPGPRRPGRPSGPSGWQVRSDVGGDALDLHVPGPARPSKLTEHILRRAHVPERWNAPSSMLKMSMEGHTLSHCICDSRRRASPISPPRT